MRKSYFENVNCIEMMIGANYPMAAKEELRALRATASAVKDILDDTIDLLNVWELQGAIARSKYIVEDLALSTASCKAYELTAISLSFAVKADLTRAKREELGFEDAPDSCWFYYLEGEKDRAVKAARERA